MLRIIFILTLCLLPFTKLLFASEGLQVMSGIAPYAFVAEKIGGNYVAVQTLMGQGQDPHTFSPSPKQLLSLGKVQLYILSGLDFEVKLSAKLQKSFPDLSFVQLNDAILPAHLLAEEHGAEDNGFEDQHAWLSPFLLGKQAEIIATAFSHADPKHSKVYEANLQLFQKELAQLSERIGQQLKPFYGRSFFVFHPAFGHFGKAFGLHQVAVEESGRLPTAKKVTQLIMAAKKDGVQLIFVQPQFDQSSAKVVAAAIGGAVVVVDPLAKDVLGTFATMAEELEKAF